MELSDMRFWLGGEWTRYLQQLLNKFLSSALIYDGSSECIRMSLNASVPIGSIPGDSNAET